MESPSARRRRWRLLPLFSLLILLVPLVTYEWGSRASAFDVQRVEVVGAQRVSAAKAAAALRARFLHHNLFAVKAADVAHALATFPYLADVQVDREFPNTLRVRLVEYRPVACLLAAKRWYIVADNGKVLVDVTPKRPRPGSESTKTTAAPPSEVSATASASPSLSSPSPAASASQPATGSSALGVTGASSAAGQAATATGATALPAQARRLPIVRSAVPVRVGGIVSDAGVRDALALLGALPTSLRAQVAEVKQAPESLLAVLRSGLRIEFGTTTQLRVKMVALDAVLGAYHRHHVAPTYIDVSLPNRPLGMPILVATTATLPATPAASPSSHTPSPSSQTSPPSSPTPSTSSTSQP